MVMWAAWLDHVAAPGRWLVGICSQICSCLEIRMSEKWPKPCIIVISIPTRRNGKLFLSVKIEQCQIQQLVNWLKSAVVYFQGKLAENRYTCFLAPLSIKEIPMFKKKTKSQSKTSHANGRKSPRRWQSTYSH